MQSIKGLVNDLATLEKTEHQLVKERCREVETAEDQDEQQSMGRANGAAAGPASPVTGDIFSIQAKLKDTEKVLASKMKGIAALQERLQVAEKFNKDHAGDAAEVTRLTGRLAELQTANAELQVMVSDMSSRLALHAEGGAAAEVDRKMDELTRVYELLSKTEDRLNRAEADAAKNAHALEEARTALQTATRSVTTLTEESTRQQEGLIALENQLREAKGCAQYQQVQDLQKTLADMELKHQQAIQRQEEEHRVQQAQLRRDQAALERKYHALQDEHRDSPSTNQQTLDIKGGGSSDPEPAAPLPLEAWCTRVVIGFVVLSVFVVLFLRRVVPHTTICMRDGASLPKG